ncbi:hypothetical protein AGMMS49975_00710 [Clostridia bacterium]|nr:hypothetical protein AGMMS49975_00710 [Clostridia bacterium]
MQNSQYYSRPRLPEDIAEQQRLFEEAQITGEWKQARGFLEVLRMTWYYTDFGAFVPKEYVTPERLTARYGEVLSAKQVRAAATAERVKSKTEGHVGQTSVLGTIEKAKTAPKPPRKAEALDKCKSNGDTEL